MWMLTCAVLFAAGYAASVYSWPAIRLWINGVAAEADKLPQSVVQLEAKLRDM